MVTIEFDLRASENFARSVSLAENPYGALLTKETLATLG